MTGIIGLLFSLVAGIILLLAGRRLFWLFVGLLGFAVGFGLAGLVLGERSGFWPLIIALVLGVLGAGLAVSLQKIALAVAGFAAGGYVLAFVLQAAGLILPAVIPWIVGGVLGAILLTRLFEWALVALSAATGAILLARAIPVLEGYVLIKFAVLLLIGVVVQSTHLLDRRKHH